MTDSVARILSSGYRASFVVAGGGSGAMHELLSHAGASNVVLEVQVPYSAAAMFDYLGEHLESFCSAEAAAIMAGRAYERAVTFTLTGEDQGPILGVACTSALQTTRQRRGDDRAYFAIKSRNAEALHEVAVPVGSRAEQEAAVSTSLLECIAEFLGEQAG